MNNSIKFNRRDMIKAGIACSFIPSFGKSGLTNAAQEATLVPKAKSVIQIWMWGGPSHLDTFDPKPGAGEDYTGPYKSPIETNIKGIRICEQLPQLAKMADKYSIIRSMTHGSNGHETASYITQTGRQPGMLVYPSTGAVVSMFKGYKNGYNSLIPPYVILTEPQGRFSETGFLGPKYKPFSTGGDPNKNIFTVAGVVAEGITEKQQESRRELLHSLNTFEKNVQDNKLFKQHNKCEEQAYELILGEEGKVFDLSQESDELRDRYGRNTFGQSCLAARRLVEIGVPYITINYKGWDTHKQHFGIMNRKLPEMDSAMAALLQDLSDRGLLDSTIVWWSGEFGRTPKILWEQPWNGGRSHFGNCFCSMVAGGGFKGGSIVGSSNDKGMEPLDRPTHPSDLLASIYTLCGIDPLGSLPNPLGEDIKVMPPKGKILTEIM
ncbi:MAG: DUF1501 domain-containing protein [Sedimentisphaeraceae bacterium JB056]